VDLYQKKKSSAVIASARLKKNFKINPRPFSRPPIKNKSKNPFLGLNPILNRQYPYYFIQY